MRTIRFFFSKKGEAAYISHLDLQRVMARALRKSGIPVWYSQGFNPHIYISFALPLPLAQESVAETMDCKTEAEDETFDRYIEPLNAALPRGIQMSKITLPVYKAEQIALAQYNITPAQQGGKSLAEVAECYNQLETAVVVRKTKRSEQPADLKTYVPTLALAEEGEWFTVCLPAGSCLNLNPELLAEFLRRHCGFAKGPANILRTAVFTNEGKMFC